MEERPKARPRADGAPAPEVYEPPQVESVLTPEELERQAHYAGSPGASPGTGPTGPG